MKKILKNPISWLAIPTLLYLIIGYLIVPVIIKGQIISLLKDKYNRETEIESVSFNPLIFNLAIDGFVLYDNDRTSFLSWETLDIDLNILPLFNSEIELESIKLKNPSVIITRTSKTEFNFTDLIKAPQLPIDAGWTIHIKQMEVQNSSLTFLDSYFDSTPKLLIDNINFEATDIHLISSDTSRFKAEMNFGDGGTMNSSGYFTFQPISASVRYELSDFSLNFVNQYLKSLNWPELKSGIINTFGDISLSIDNKNELPFITYNGEFEIDDLNLYDPKTDKDLAKWSSFSANKIFISSSPFLLRVNEVVLNEFYASVVIDTSSDIVKVLKSIPGIVEEAKSNISNLTQTPVDDISFEISDITINNCAITLTDLSLPQKFMADIHSLNGKISGLSKNKPLSTSLSVNGLVDQSGQAKIVGRINLLDPLSFAVLNIDFKNIDLTHFSPYSMKFVGYKVKNGKMSLSLKYEMKNEKFISKNYIHLNELTLGEKVEQTSLLDFPLEAGIALLKDKNGNIDLDIDINGDLNDPDINYGELVWWAVKRSFTTVIEAPFVYFGELIGIEGYDLEYITFNPGESILLPDEKVKLTHINNTFNERPGITLEIYAAADLIADAKVIRSKKLNTAYLKRKRKGSVGTDSLISLQTVGSNYDRNILELMYVEIFGKEKFDDLQTQYFPQVNQADSASSEEFDQTEYITEMISKLENEQQISDAEILNLANARAEIIKNFLLTFPNVTPERLVMKEAEIYEQEDQKLIKCKLGIGSI